MSLEGMIRKPKDSKKLELSNTVHSILVEWMMNVLSLLDASLNEDAR